MNYTHGLLWFAMLVWYQSVVLFHQSNCRIWHWCIVGFVRWVYYTHVVTHYWGRVTHICVWNLTIIGSDHGLSPGRRQAIIWTNTGILWIGPLGTNFSEIWIGILTFSFRKMRLKMSSAKSRPFCLGLNVLRLVYKHKNPPVPVKLFAKYRWMHPFTIDNIICAK